jgi:hypothetical protein
MSSGAANAAQLPGRGSLAREHVVTCEEVFELRVDASG